MNTTTEKKQDIDLELEQKLNDAAGKVINLSKQRLELKKILDYQEHKLLKMWANKVAHDEMNENYQSTISYINSLRNRIASFNHSIVTAKVELKILVKGVVFI